MKRFTSYGCRHTQYTGGGGGGAEARPGAATDTAAAAAPAAAPAATAATAPAIFKTHTLAPCSARRLERAPPPASAASCSSRSSSRAGGGGGAQCARARGRGGRLGEGAHTTREAPRLLPALRAGPCVSRTSSGRLRAPLPRVGGAQGQAEGHAGRGEAADPEDARGGVGRVAPEGGGRVRSPSRRAERERERGREVLLPLSGTRCAVLGGGETRKLEPPPLPPPDR